MVLAQVRPAVVFIFPFTKEIVKIYMDREHRYQDCQRK
jgi:hypothetical protein